MVTLQWITKIVLALMISSMVGAGTSHADPTDASPTDVEHRNAETVRQAFTRDVGGPESFYSILAEDVSWTVMRATGSSTYTSRQQFLDSGAAPILDRLTGPIRAEVREIISSDNQVIALWRGTATAIDGLPYVNEYAWVMTMENSQVTRVLAYLDIVALDDLINRVSVG